MDYGGADVLEGFAEFVADELRRTGRTTITFEDTDPNVDIGTKLAFGERAGRRASEILRQRVQTVVSSDAVHVTLLGPA